MDLSSFTGLEAAGADSDLLYDPINACPNRPKVGVKPAFGQIMGVRNIVAKHRPFAAEITNSRQRITSKKSLDFYDTDSSLKIKGFITIFFQPLQKP